MQGLEREGPSESPPTLHNEDSGQMPDIYRLYENEKNTGSCVANKLEVYLNGTDPLNAAGVENSAPLSLRLWSVRGFRQGPRSTACKRGTFHEARGFLGNNVAGYPVQILVIT